jgi:hypothetical protein
MSSEQSKTLLYVAWGAVVCLAALASGLTSVPWWMVVVCVAIVPPAVARTFWRAPEQTLSETINKARR